MTEQTTAPEEVVLGYAVVRRDTDRRLRYLDFDDEVYETFEAALDSQGGEMGVDGPHRIVKIVDVFP